MLAHVTLKVVQDEKEEMRMTTKAKSPPRRSRPKSLFGRLTRPTPDLIPDIPEHIARACMQEPPKKQWRYEENNGA